jgi:hypothetical protein
MRALAITMYTTARMDYAKSVRTRGRSRKLNNWYREVRALLAAKLSIRAFVDNTLLAWQARKETT